MTVYTLKNIDKLAKKMKQRPRDVVALAFVELSTSIILRTPVDTGRARGNWIPTANTPGIGYDNETLDKTGQKAIDAATAIAQMTNSEKFILTNNLPYIGVLEYQGWSKQAPAGMVRISVIEFQDAINKAIAETD